LRFKEVVVVKFNRNNRVLVLSSSLLAFGFVFSIYFIWFHRKSFSDEIIYENIKKLSVIFDDIRTTAGIQSFDHQKNEINFLNVASFKGSEVGTMNLDYPKRWNGPYLTDNPESQGRYFLVVNTKNGYFITPGEGVKLANGKTVGKEISLDRDSDIELMMYDKEYLLSDFGPLAVKLLI
jgi:hypothetical protein